MTTTIAILLAWVGMKINLYKIQELERGVNRSTNWTENNLLTAESTRRIWNKVFISYLYKNKADICNFFLYSLQFHAEICYCIFQNYNYANIWLSTSTHPNFLSHIMVKAQGNIIDYSNSECDVQKAFW